MMQRQTGYQFIGSGKAWAGIFDSEIAQGLLMMRRSETDIQVAAAGLRAAGTLSATIRLPAAVNRAQGTVRQMAAHVRSDKVKPAAKMLKTFGQVQERLAAAIGPDFAAVIARSQTGVKLVSDVPLEWLSVGNLPLMLAKDVSRISATPGNLQIGLLSRSQLVHLPPEAFHDILVISAFDPKDPIATVLLDTLDQWRSAYGDKIRLTIVRVQTRQAFVDAVNTFRGGVMIFDGHGHHDHATGVATLRIGRDDVSIWDLKGEIESPPIVILSACDTQAADRSHATTANAFLNAGATTVLASLLPLRADDAAMFIGRLILRLAEYLPAVTGREGRAVLWSEAMSGMLRLQLVFDLVMPQMDAGKITMAQYSSLNFGAIEMTTNQDPDWWSTTVSRLGAMLGLTDQAANRLAARTIATSDAIRYTQIGNPELIVIKSVALLEEVGYDMSDAPRT